MFVSRALLAMVVLVTMLLASSAAAQVSTFDLSGTVTDQSGGVMPGASVQLRNVLNHVAGRRADNAVFIAYVPRENPKLAVAVVIPDGEFGGWGAAPIARKIFDAYDYEVGLNGTPGKQKDQANNSANAGTTGTANQP